MNDITREAGVSKGTTYVYFANKVELFEALVDEERCGMFNNMYDVPNQGGNLRETLIRFGVALVSKVTS
jgi:AcrR family transcriptional regulator